MNFPPLGTPQRCKWARHDALLADYHDREWGRPILTDSGHLERMVHEIFQCGLSWKIVLVKRDALREAFRGYEIDRVARMSQRDVERLLTNAAIIRNRKKIEATIENARRFRAIINDHDSFLTWFNALPAATTAQRRKLSETISKTFRFMGPETTKCYLWGVGKVLPPHERGCWIQTTRARTGNAF